jgi:phospholipid/cholesterol/gamma-HCH transport system ATP-binding protein
MEHEDSLGSVSPNSQSSPEYIVEFRNIYKAFGSQRVLRGLNLKIPERKITFIIGRSGEGKSVTIKHIVGVLRPDSGSIVVDDEDMSQATEAQWRIVRRKIGLLFQDGALFDSMSVFENICFPLKEFTKLSPKEMKAEVKRLLDLVGLKGIEARIPSELSIGEKKRVGLARALALKPKLLLYDEPTTGMDSLVAELIDDLIRDMQEKNPGLSSVVISHDIRSVLSTAEHIVLLHEGQIYLEGSPEEFKASTDPLVRQFLSGARHGPLAKVIT